MFAAPTVWTVMVALLGVHLAGMGAFLTLPVLAPLIARELDLPPSLVGLHTGLVYAGALVSGPFTGLLLRRHGGIRVCQGALVLIGCGIALAVLGHPLALAASALLAGLGHGPVTPSGSHLLAGRVPPRQRSLIFSLKQCGVPAGSMLTAALAPAVGVAFGWRAGALTMAALALLAALALQPLRAALDADRDPTAAGGPRAAWRDAVGSLGLVRRDSRLRSLTCAAACFGVSQFCFAAFFVAWQVEVLGTPLTEAGLRMALAQGAGVAGRVFWGLLADRVGPVPVLVAIGAGAVLGCVALAFAGPAWPGLAVTLAGMVLGATGIGWNGVLLGEVARIAPQGRVGGATAALGVVFGVVQVVMPVAFTALVAGTGAYLGGFLLCAACALAGAFWVRGGR